jgi:hypothetical protein
MEVIQRVSAGPARTGSRTVMLRRMGRPPGVVVCLALRVISPGEKPEQRQKGETGSDRNFQKRDNH